MNEYKICFIICANNEKRVMECQWYIDKLTIPDGYEKEVIVIYDAVSMASGYNAAMRNSDAKYKVYLQENVFLINSNLLIEMLCIFQDETIGMLGVVGNTKILRAADYAQNWDCKKLLVSNIFNIYKNSDINGYEEAYVEVECVDGCFMATQYDLPWDERIFDGWDFYDIDQSIQFRQAGYRIVVPCQNTAMWLLWEKKGGCREWEKYRKIFCEKYDKLGYRYFVSNMQQVNKEENEIVKQFIAAAEQKDINKAEVLKKQLKEFVDKGLVQDEMVWYASIFLDVYKAEQCIAEDEDGTEMQLGEFIDYYTEVVFQMRRVAYDQTSESWEYLREKFISGDITMPMMWTVKEKNSQLINEGLSRKLMLLFVARLKKLLEQGKILSLIQSFSLMPKSLKENNVQIGVMGILVKVFQKEVDHDVPFTVFDYSNDWDELIEHFLRLKNLMRRLEFGMPLDSQREFYEYCTATNVSDYFLLYLLSNNIYRKEETCKNLSALYAAMEGEDSLRTKLYLEMGQGV